MTYFAIRINFIVAVWLTILSCAVILLRLHPATFPQDYPGSRAPTGLALLLFFELGMWFHAFRKDEGYAAATLLGLILATPVIAVVLIPQVSDARFDNLEFAYFAYLSMSHFAYAVANWRAHHRSWLDGL